MIPQITATPSLPLFNRTQRRTLSRYITHKAQLQLRHVLRSPERRAARLASLELHCDRCHLRYLGPSAARCQCKIEVRP